MTGPVAKYSCFSEEGEIDLPSNEQIEELIRLDVEPVIFLDSCVCLHIIRVIDYGRLAKNVDFNKIVALKEYLGRHPNVKLNPFFALMELCSQEAVLDRKKLWDFKCRIDFFDLLPVKVFKSFKYNFDMDFLFLGDYNKPFSDPISGIQPLLNSSYCALLKIRSLALKGLTRNVTEKNIRLFLDWMINDLDQMRGTEFKLATGIFGGDTALRKMIALDSKPSLIKKTLLGTCWDIFHSQNTSNSFRLFELLQRNIHPYFLTSDANLFKLFKNFSLRLIKDGGDQFVSSFILNSDLNAPHLGEDFIDELNEKMMMQFLDRRHQVHNYDENRILQLIEELEFENGMNAS